MKLKATFLTAALAGLTFSSCNSNSISARSSAVDSVSYAFGINIGESLKNTKIEGLNPDIIARGIADMMNNDGVNAKMTSEESIEVIESFFQEMQERMLLKNMKEGEEFLARNRDVEGVITTESGLQYKVITQGKGPKPGAEDEVEVHYRGMLLSGEEFDSSYENGQPIKLRLGSVIAGWTEGLQLVNEGSKVMLWIPADLAYGQRRAGNIEPNSTLMFEVELLKVFPAAKK